VNQARRGCPTLRGVSKGGRCGEEAADGAD